jgi:two-component system sensor histidine kinase BaeS
MRLPSAPPPNPDIAMERDRVSASGVVSGDNRYDRAPPSAALPPLPSLPSGASSLHDGGARDTPPEGPPVTLYDARHELVASTGQLPPPGSAMRPVVYSGKVVGWLAVNGPDTLSDAADIAFQAQQKRSTWQIAGVAVVLAALVALILARIVLAPVKRLMNATHRLAGGDYTTRVPAGRRDELGRLAGDFNVLADSLQKAERSRRDFIADISHELRTPLAVLRGELEAIEDGVHVFNRDSLTSLQTEVNMLNKLIEDLYELSLSDVGALSYRKAPTHVGQLARASIEAMRESFKAKRIALELTCTPEIADRTFAVDPARFVQLLKNLLLNSLRYTDPDGQVHVALSQSASGWQLDVQDSLPGVPEAALDHLFDRFYRVDESRSRQNGGAGLGLSLCHAIVTAHGGTIGATASPLGGVWITARFPPEGD